MSVLATQEDRELRIQPDWCSSSSTAPSKAQFPLGPQLRLRGALIEARGGRRIASGLEGLVTVPLRSHANASLFWIILLLV
jgi:hypothetical protein